jgi:DNA-directed RNA polymerase specialized sigma subunit
MVKKKKKQKKTLEPLEAIKRLLMLNAVLNGASSKDIAKILGITERRVQQMIPLRSIKKGK